MSQAKGPHDVQVDVASGAQLVGGDMGGWTDIVDPGVSRAVGAVVTPLLESLEPARVLLVGPAASLLLPLVPSTTSVEVVVRGRLDAQNASDLGGLHRDLRLVCGGLDRFEPVEPFDLVVALGGPQRMIGYDTEGISYEAMMSRLGQMLNPDGVLVVDGWNELGINRQLATSPLRQQSQPDENWVVGADGFDSRDLYLHEFEATIAAHGMKISREYGVFPDAETPLILAARETLEDGVSRSLVMHLAARAVAGGFSDQPVLVEPVGQTVKVFEAGLAFDMAASWVAVATRGQSVPVEGLPDIVHCESGVGSRWARLITIHPQSESPEAAISVSWVSGQDDDEVSESDISRTLQPPHEDAAMLLQDMLRDACASGRHEPIRELVRRYHEWLSDDDAWAARGAGRRFFAVPDNVAVPGDAEAGQWELFDPSWHRSIVWSAENAFVRGLRDFSRKLLASASPHPWRSSISADELTRTLASMAGIAVHSTLLNTIAEQEVFAARVVNSRTDDDFEEQVIRNREATATGMLTPAATAVGYRELFAHDRQMTRSVNTMEAQIAWLEGTMKLRDRRIRELEAQIARMERTMLHQAGQVMSAPRRIATTIAMDKAVDSVPPPLRDRALRFAQRITNSN